MKTSFFDVSNHISAGHDIATRAHPIYWIGGSPCSGKSTITDALANRFKLQDYRCDDAYYQHQHLVTVVHQPIFTRLSRASCDEIWLRPVPQQIEEERALYQEEFPFVLDDLNALARTGPVIAEGAALLPDVLDAIGVAPERSIWIVPTEGFQRSHYALREWRHDVVATCSDPELAWENWMARDVGFATAVAANARRLRRRILVVDGTRSIEETIDDVAQWFGLSRTE
jgi:hypothetical protein